MKTDVLTSTFMRFRARLHGVAAGIAGPDSAEDVLHDAFCRLWSRHPDIGDESEAIKLGYTAVRNSAIDLFRSTHVHPRVAMDDIHEQPSDEDESLTAREKEETYATVVRLSRRALNETQYTVFRLHDIEGATYPEIAQGLGMTQENVRMTLSRARKAIRELYRKTNHD